VIPAYPKDRLYEEIAFLAYHFHWPYDDILNMEHRDRLKWCAQVSRINKKINEESKNENSL